MNDQAAALRQMIKQKNQQEVGRLSRIITVTSGKGGVGKSNFSLNFALSMQKLGLKVLIFDADIGMANIDVLMGVSSQYNLYHLLKGTKTIWDIVQEGPGGIHFIAGGSGFSDLLRLSSDELESFAAEIEKLQSHYDVILFDTGAGLSKETARFIAAAQETIVVTTPEPTSITDAYALIKMVTGMQIDTSFRLIVNRAMDSQEGKLTATKMNMVSQKFLQLELPLLGIVPDDANISRAVKKQQPFTLAYPQTEASRAIREIASKYLDIPQLPSAGKGIKGFLHRMLKLSH